MYGIKLRKALDIKLFLLIIGMSGVNCAVADQGTDIGDGWIFSGDVRAGWVKYNYSNPRGRGDINKGHRDSEGFYVVPKLSLQTPTWNGFYGKITGAGATDFGLNNENRQGRNFVFDANELESFAILQEAYIAWESDNKEHSALVGRNEIVTPMIEADDYYFLANSFEVATYTNRSIENVMLTGGYFHRMAGVWDSGANGTEFHSMSDASFVASEDKKRADDSGVGYLGVQYDNGTHNAQLWGYHAPDLYDILFTQYDFSQKLNSLAYDFGLQYIKFKEDGELAKHDTTEIDFNMVSARFDGSFDNGWGFATGVTDYSDGEGQGATLGAWGAFPYFANGMVFHFFEAGSLRNATSYKVQGSYDLSNVGVKNLKASLRYTYFSLDSDYSFSSDGRPQDEMELFGLKLDYSFANGGYFAMTYEHQDTDNENSTYALRLIGGYRF